MKLKKLKKKIQQLEKRLREGPQKLAKLRRRLQEAESAQKLKAARKSAARATASAGKKSLEPTAGNEEAEQRKESEEKIESFTGTSCATFCHDESQVGCEDELPRGIAQLRRTKIFQRRQCSRRKTEPTASKHSCHDQHR